MNYVNFYKNIKTIAVIGLSDKPDRPSYKVAKYMMEHGYKIFPVNPNIDNFLGIKSFDKLTDIMEQIDVVNIFRKSELVGPIVDDAIQIGAKFVWMQEGIANLTAAKKARRAGLEVIMNSCIMKQYKSI